MPLFYDLLTAPATKIITIKAYVFSPLLNIFTPNYILARICQSKEKFSPKCISNQTQVLLSQWPTGMRFFSPVPSKHFGDTTNLIRPQISAIFIFNLKTGTPSTWVHLECYRNVTIIIRVFITGIFSFHTFWTNGLNPNLSKLALQWIRSLELQSVRLVHAVRKWNYLLNWLFSETWYVLGFNMSYFRYVLLHHVMGELEGRKSAWAYVEGGMGSVSQSIANAARSMGTTVMTNKVGQQYYSLHCRIKRLSFDFNTNVQFCSYPRDQSNLIWAVYHIWSLLIYRMTNFTLFGHERFTLLWRFAIFGDFLFIAPQSYLVWA